LVKCKKRGTYVFVVVKETVKVLGGEPALLVLARGLVAEPVAPRVARLRAGRRREHEGLRRGHHHVHGGPVLWYLVVLLQLPLLLGHHLVVVVHGPLGHRVQHRLERPFDVPEAEGHGVRRKVAALRKHKPQHRQHSRAHEDQDERAWWGHFCKATHAKK